MDPRNGEALANYTLFLEQIGLKKDASALYQHFIRFLFIFLYLVLFFVEFHLFTFFND